MNILGELNPRYRGWPEAFHEAQLPPRVVRVSAALVVLASAAAVMIAALLPIPERVTGDFVLTSVDDAGPLRAPEAGMVASVRARAGQQVRSGDVLFVIQTNDAAVNLARPGSMASDLPADRATDVDLRAGLYAVRAPVTGLIVEMGPARRGAVIERGDFLAHVAATNARLAVDLVVPDLEAGRLQPGLPVKLRLDAYPYTRYGTKSATVAWVSPRAESGSIAVHAVLPDHLITVDGEVRALTVGMRGKANIVVGRRTLVELALEPLTRLRQNVAEARAFEERPNTHRHVQEGERP